MEKYTLTYKVFWFAHSATNGYPIYHKLKVKGRKPVFEHSGLYIDNRNEWNDQRKKVVRRQDAEDMNDALTKKNTEWKKQYLKDYLDDKKSSPALKRKKVSGFFEYAKAVRGNVKNVRTLINNIKEFQESEPLVKDIDIEWCRLYETFLREEKSYGKNSINTDFKILRRVTNQAVLEKHLSAKVIGKGAYAMPGPGETTPTFLIKEQRLTLLAGLDNEELKKNKVVYRALVYFLLSVYTGFRHGDIRKFDLIEHVIGDMIVLRTTKTNELVVYPLDKIPAKILALIKELGPFRMDYKTYNNYCLKKIAKHLKLDVNLTSHVGRHSFGRLMAEVGVSESDCAWFMGNISIQTVKIYYHITGKIRTDRILHLVII